MYMERLCLHHGPALEFNTQRDRAVCLICFLLLELPRAVNTHNRQPDAVSGQHTLPADTDRRLGNPWPPGNTVT